MGWQEIVTSFVGGGIAVAFIEWVREVNRERSARHVDYLKDQLRCLYGPLSYYLTHNEQIFAFLGKIDEAYRKEFVDSPRSQSREEHVQERIDRDAMKTITISNAYVNMAIANGGKIEEIIVANFNYIDPDDLDLARRFMHDRMRVRLEREPEDKTRFPYPVDRSLGPYSFHRSDFAKRIEEKFRTKSDQLRRLQHRTPWYTTILVPPRWLWAKITGH